MPLNYTCDGSQQKIINSNCQGNINFYIILFFQNKSYVRDQTVFIRFKMSMFSIIDCVIQCLQ